MLAVDYSDTSQSDAKAAAMRAAAWIAQVGESRDKAAFGNLYRQFAPKVKRYMMRQGADDATADDLAQDTMVQVWRKAALYNPDKAAASSWIFTIARNQRIDKLRRQKFHEVELADEMLESGGVIGHTEDQPGRLDADRLAQQVADLPADQAEVIRLSFFEGLTHSEIGGRLDLPLGTVKSRLRLAFGKLRTAMGDQI
jgi:RNA polymerase sigma-70 factor (ECF subfamily)